MDPEPHSLLLLFFNLNTAFITGVIGFCVLLILSAIISGAEVALFSLSKSEIDNASQTHPKQIKTIKSLLESPKKLLATILITNNFINVAVVILFAFLGEVLFESIATAWVKFLLEVVLVTFFILLFGEIIPKIYARRNALQFSRFISKPLNVLNKVLSPLNNPMKSLTVAIERTFTKSKTSNISVDQLSYALELTKNEETNSDEHKILKGIVSFGSTDTKQVMIPRIDIFALSNNTPFDSVLSQIASKGFSRIPVYEENIDHVIGVLYAKDLLPHLNKKDFEWQAILRPPFFVPENKKLDDLMQEFQSIKTHLAIVVDEYGGTSGVISLEDVIEEIVGDISDEFDDFDLLFTKLDKSNYLFEGKTALKDFYKILDIDGKDFEEHKGEAETLAGFILERHGLFPRQGHTINFKNYGFKINSIERKRIKQIHLNIKS